MTTASTMFVYSDGGRAAAGFRGTTSDCVTRALAIATGVDYRTCYNLVAAINWNAGRPRSARDGAWPKHYRPVLNDLFNWEPFVGIGTGVHTHLNPEELPSEGRIIARCSRHLVAVIDGMPHDSHDSTRCGTRAVYGVWHVGDDPATIGWEIEAWTEKLNRGRR